MKYVRMTYLKSDLPDEIFTFPISVEHNFMSEALSMFKIKYGD